MEHISLFNYLAASLLFGVTLFGGILSSKQLSPKNTQQLIAFTGSYLFSTILLHNLPELFDQGATLSPYSIGIFLAAGFYLQLFLDFTSMGIAHNHNHTVHEENDIKPKQPTAVTVLLLSLVLHALLEGIFIAKPTHHHHHGHHHTDFLLLISIMLHKVPAAFSLTAAFQRQKISKRLTRLALVLFALATPAAYLLTLFVEHHTSISLLYLIPLSAVATGSILHIAATILFESDLDHNISLKKWLAILIGSITAFLPMLFH